MFEKFSTRLWYGFTEVGFLVRHCTTEAAVNRDAVWDAVCHDDPLCGGDIAKVRVSLCLYEVREASGMFPLLFG